MKRGKNMLQTTLNTHLDIKKGDCPNCNWDADLKKIEEDIIECNNCWAVYKYSKKGRIWFLLREGV